MHYDKEGFAVQDYAWESTFAGHANSIRLAFASRKEIAPANGAKSYSRLLSRLPTNRADFRGEGTGGRNCLPNDGG